MLKIIDSIEWRTLVLVSTLMLQSRQQFSQTAFNENNITINHTP